VVQEIDIATGKVLFEWDSLDHIPVTDTYAPFSGGTKSAPFDYLHINSIAIAPDGDLLLSARDTSAIYKVARPSGKGNLPYFSEFAADGTLLLDGQFPIGDQSYRAFTADWAGHPADRPAVAARVNPAGGSVVYAS
jgi:hypothetical protein